MNSNKISCHKYVLLNSLFEFIPYLGVKFASQISHEKINKPLDGAYLANFGIDITQPHLFNPISLKLWVMKNRYTLT